MNSALETRELWLRTLTPVHVGTGEELAPGLEILSVGGRTFVLDLERILAQERIDADRLASALGGATRGLGEAVLEELRRAGLDPAGVSRYVLEGSWLRGRLRLQIREAGGRPLVPGSSLKGALRTLALAALLGAERDAPSAQASERVRAALERLPAGRRERAAEFAWTELEEPVLAARAGSPRGLDGPRRDLLRLVHCSDAAFDASTLRIAELAVHRGRAEQAPAEQGERASGPFLGSPIGAEVIADGARARTRVGLDRWLFDQGARHLWRGEPALGWQRLAEVSQSRARAIVRREAGRFRELGQTRAAERLETLGLAGLHGEAIVLRLGFGIGWEGTTGGLVDDGVRQLVRTREWPGRPTSTWSGRGFPSSRKLVRAIWRRSGPASWHAFEGLDLSLGWVVLEPIDAAPGPRETQGSPRPSRAADREPRVGAGGAAGRRGREGTRPAGDDRRGRRGERPSDRRGARDERPAAAARGPAALRPGAEVRAVVLEERTKKGAWRFRIESFEREAHLQPGGPAAPEDLAAGLRVVLLVRAVPASKGQAVACHWVRREDEAPA